MLTGFEKIVEERIRRAQQEGRFADLRGRGRPLRLEDDQHIPEDLRLCHKILKNANYLPPALEIKKQIRQTEDLMGAMTDTAEKYRTLKKLNYLIMKYNTLKAGASVFDIPQRYDHQLVRRMS